MGIHGKWLSTVISGGKPDRKKEKEIIGQQKQAKPMMKPLEHAARAQASSAAVSSTGKIKESEYINTNSQEDVDKAAEALINGFRRDLELQRMLSDRRYYGYLERSS